MRITECHIDAFGHLRDFHLEDLSSPVVAVLGPNEAGKSTFFHFLQTMLYGIYPTDAARHEYAPRDGRRLEGSVVLEQQGGKQFTVARRLLSTPQGRLLNGEAEEDLRNRTVPSVQHVPQTVFEAVYALSLQDMVAIDGKAWEEVQERLLGGLGIDFIRPAGEVIGDLEERATSLWRPDRRGKPRARELRKRLKALSTAFAEARERDAELRALHDEIAERRQRLEELEEEKISLKSASRRADRLRPVRKLLSKIEQLENEAGDPDDWRDLPDDPRGAGKALDDRLAELEDAHSENERRQKEARRQTAAYTAADARLVEEATRIRAWSKKAAAHENDLKHLEHLRRDADASKTRLEGQARRLLSRAWDDALIPPIMETAEAELRQRVRSYDEAAERLREAEAQARALELSSDRQRSPLTGAVMAVAGLIVLAVGLWVGAALLQLLGMAALVGGAVQVYYVLRHNREAKRRGDALDVEPLRRTAEERGSAVAELLEDIPFPEERLHRPDADLISDLQSLRNEVERYRSATAGLEELEEVVAAAEKEVEELASTCGREPGASASETIIGLEEHLEAAEKRRSEAEDAEARLERLEKEGRELSDDLTRTRKERQALDDRLADLGGGDPLRGVEVLDQRRTAWGDAEHHKRTLRRDFPDWEELQAEIEEIEREEGAWAYTDEEIVRLEEQIEDVERQLREASAELVGLERDEAALREGESADAVASEIVFIEEQLEEVARERDRLMLLARIVSRADHRFRMKHQPGVIRRAGEYLKSITGGRYERLVLDETDDLLKVVEAGGMFPTCVEAPLSQGTRDQIFLALRLAIIDHLDEGRERLPVFLDEVFVNWDRGRRRSGFGILSDLAARRQIFVFTCHPWLAQELEAHLDARVVRLAQ